MNRIKEEGGYALVTVFLIVTIFAVIFLAFMGQAFSSVKQNKVVEKKSQSIAAAEMGVSLYQVSIQNLFETKLANFKKTVSPTASNFNLLAASQLSSDIQSAFVAKYPIGSAFNPVTGNLNVSITNKKFTVTPDKDKIIIKFEVLGKENEKETTLDGQMTIDLSPSVFNIIKKPTSPDCTTYASTCEEVLLDNSEINPPNGVSDQVIYSTGNLILDGPVNQMQTMQIHGETITISGNTQHVYNSTIESEGDMYVNGHLTPPTQPKDETLNLNLYVGGKLTVDGKLEFSSTDIRKAYVKKGVQVKDSMVLGPNYTMCIKGDLTVPRLDILGSLYVLGNLTVPQGITNSGNFYLVGSIKDGNVSGNGVKYNSFPTDLQEKCGATFTDPTIQTIINNVDYN